MTACRAPIVEDLCERLPSVRGKIALNEPLARSSWFGVGGQAQALFKPADTQDLADFCAALDDDIPVTVLGVGSNVIIRDGGIPGVVVRLGPQFATIATEGTRITAGAAALDLNVARAAEKASIAGLSFLSGIPGTIGGGLRMNAGAYGGAIKDILKHATAVDRAGKIHVVGPQDMDMRYRATGAPADWIFTQATFEGSRGDGDAIRAEMDAIKAKREASQPIHEKTGGSTFANPEGHKAWALIDAAGCRGLRIGGALMSPQHCNFMINTGTATAADLETLGEEVRRRVEAQSGILLRWEIKRIGIPLDERTSA